MNNDLDSHWERVKTRAQEIWNDLTDQDMEKLQGSWHQAVAYLQEKYCDTKEAIEDTFRAWLK